MWWGHSGGTTFEVGFLSLLGKWKYYNADGINRRDMSVGLAGAVFVGSLVGLLFYRIHKTWRKV